MGGETYFPMINKGFKGNAGDLLIFPNVNSDGKIWDLSLHESLPILEGNKYLVNVWENQNF